jgi:hydrogenase maturation protein HypF
LEGEAIDTKPLFETLVEEIRGGVPVPVMGRRFHNGLARVLADAALRAGARHGVDRICLSGGTFQNVLLTGTLSAMLEGSGLEVYTHAQVPANDGGLSLGQALIAAHEGRR